VKVYPDEVYEVPGAMGNAQLGRVNTLDVDVAARFHDWIFDPGTPT